LCALAGNLCVAILVREAVDAERVGDIELAFAKAMPCGRWNPSAKVVFYFGLAVTVRVAEQRDLVRFGFGEQDVTIRCICSQRALSSPVAKDWRGTRAQGQLRFGGRLRLGRALPACRRCIGCGDGACLEQEVLTDRLSVHVLRMAYNRYDRGAKSGAQRQRCQTSYASLHCRLLVNCASRTQT